MLFSIIAPNKQLVKSLLNGELKVENFLNEKLKVENGKLFLMKIRK